MYDKIFKLIKQMFIMVCFFHILGIKNIGKNLLIFFVGILLLTSNATIISSTNNILNETDFDPLVDVEVTVEIQIIRSLENNISDKSFERLKIEIFGFLESFRNRNTGNTRNPIFYLKVFINGVEFESDIWADTLYVYEPWSATLNVPDDQEFVDIRIQLWNSTDDPSDDKLHDISSDFNDSVDGYDVELVYSIKTGHWTGDDKLSDDPSGYGRLNGCDDGTIYEIDRDCEIWFNVYQNDFDNDNIPYWTEINEYGTDPEVSNIGEDSDNDDIPIEWEWKWNYDPITSDSHRNIDTEMDGLTNYEEYLVSAWDSNPYRIDIYVELDQMAEGPNGETNLLPKGSKELLYTAFNRQNKVFHLDDGNMGGGEMIPYDEETSKGELRDIYDDYFYHGASSTWRRGVFHYGIVIHGHPDVAGAIFGNNRFYITSRGHEKKADQLFMDRDEVFASAYMHELGHTFDFGPIPGHSRDAMYPWQIGWWLNRPYRSCMNYGYMYYTVDYSDGSNANPIDYNDWERMDLRAFQWTE